jgi:hypothetical protein
MAGLSWIKILICRNEGFVFDLFIDTFRLVRCCVRKDAENSGCELTAILKFYPKTGGKTMEKSAQSARQYSCPTELKTGVLIKTKLRPFLSVILFNCQT